MVARDVNRRHVAWAPLFVVVVVATVAITALVAVVDAEPSIPGGAGYALLFSDNIATVAPFHDMPTTELTFEAWLRTSDGCHTGAVVSYAEKTTSKDASERVKAANSFVVWDIKDLLACRGFELLDRIPDPENVSCRSAFKKSKEANQQKIDISDGNWHHLAVTWNSRKKGLTTVYIDGMKRAEAETGITREIKPGGALVLGAEQDCYDGCFEKQQAFYGMMDEVRIWKRELTQSEILKNFRFSGDSISDSDLVAYWKFDDLVGDRGIMTTHYQAADSSGRNNNLNILTMPKKAEDNVIFEGRDLGFPAIDFQNNYAMNAYFQGMPRDDITIEFWSKTQAVSDASEDRNLYQELFSFAAIDPGNGDLSDDKGYADATFMDDAILIEKYNNEYIGSGWLPNIGSSLKSTIGTISVHINANRQGNGYKFDNWIDFAVGWKDDKWHHICVTWSKSTGEVRLVFDGKKKTAFWKSDGHRVSHKSPSSGGVDPYIGRTTTRTTSGSLVLGQNQECYAGCFSPTNGFHGSMAELRIWNRVRSLSDTARYMRKSLANTNQQGLAFHYTFRPYDDKIENQVDSVLNGQTIPKYVNNLKLGGSGPTWHLSYCPLEREDGQPVELPQPGTAGYALELDDQQVLMLENFQQFPSHAVTLEFWMWSADKCRKGTPFSYATGGYEKADNSFLLFDYNNWGVAVMEDEGTYKDHHSGISATDGQWHHIAVTWESRTGETILYDNGRRVWTAKRGQGKTIPSGGTVVIGREQDCLGGCFDSDPGAKGDTQAKAVNEYGSEDFFGMVEEMRLWRVGRTEAEINEGMRADDGLSKSHGYDNPGLDTNHPDLVAYWKFDAGNGYNVIDATGNGHDLRMSFIPHWRVVNWLSICGNGIVEGSEECDDGNLNDGDGCDHKCQHEPGWFCTKERPSKCSRPGDHRHYSGGDDSESKGSSSHSDSHSQYPSRGGSPKGDGSGGDYSPSHNPSLPPSSGGKKKSSHAGAITFFVFLIILGAMGTVVYFKREDLYERFPKLRIAVSNIKEKFFRKQRNYDMLHLDAGEADILAPEFVGMQDGPGAYRPPSPKPESPSPADDQQDDVLR